MIKPKIKTGQKAPSFSLPDQEGKMYKLSDFVPNKKGEYLLIYFYPKDDTSGCTMQACGVRDNLPKFEKLNCKVIGISPDSVKSHDKFVDKYNLNFTILSDESKKILNKYGVWREKSMYGKKYMGVVRTSFLIDPKGKIIKIYEKVKPETHAEDVLHDLKNYKG